MLLPVCVCVCGSYLPAGMWPHLCVWGEGGGGLCHVTMSLICPRWKIDRQFTSLQIRRFLEPIRIDTGEADLLIDVCVCVHTRDMVPEAHYEILRVLLVTINGLDFVSQWKGKQKWKQKWKKENTETQTATVQHLISVVVLKKSAHTHTHRKLCLAASWWSLNDVETNTEPHWVSSVEGSPPPTPNSGLTFNQAACTELHTLIFTSPLNMCVFYITNPLIISWGMRELHNYTPYLKDSEIFAKVTSLAKVISQIPGSWTWTKYMTRSPASYDKLVARMS